METRRCANMEVWRPRGMEAGMPACRRAGIEVWRPRGAET